MAALAPLVAALWAALCGPGLEDAGVDPARAGSALHGQPQALSSPPRRPPPRCQALGAEPATDPRSIEAMHAGCLERGRPDAAADWLDHADRLASERGSAAARRTVERMLARHLIESGSPTGARFTAAPGDLDLARASAPLAFAVGLVAARDGRIPRAQAALGRLRQLLLEPDAEPGALGPSRVLAESLEGSIALAAGLPARAVAELRDAAELDRLRDAAGGLLPPIQPAVELLGETLLELGRPGEARDAFLAALDRWPWRRRSWLGLAGAAEATGDGATERLAALRLSQLRSGASRCPAVDDQ